MGAFYKEGNHISLPGHKDQSWHIHVHLNVNVQQWFVEMAITVMQIKLYSIKRSNVNDMKSPHLSTITDTYANLWAILCCRDIDVTMLTSPPRCHYLRPYLTSGGSCMITNHPLSSCSMNMIHMTRSVLLYDHRSSTLIILDEHDHRSSILIMLNEHDSHDEVSTHAWLQIFHYHYAQWTWSTWPGQYSSIITDPPLHEHEHRSSTPIMLNEHDIHD